MQAQTKVRKQSNPTIMRSGASHAYLSMSVPLVGAAVVRLFISTPRRGASGPPWTHPTCVTPSAIMFLQRRTPGALRHSPDTETSRTDGARPAPEIPASVACAPVPWR